MSERVEILGGNVDVASNLISRQLYSEFFT